MKINRIQIKSEYYYAVQEIHPDQKERLLKLLPALSYDPTSDFYIIKHSKEVREKLGSFYKLYDITIEVQLMRGNKLRLGVFPGFAAIKYIKSLPYYHFDQVHKHWTFPYREDIWDEIKTFLLALYTDVKLIDKRIQPKKKKLFKSPVQRKAPPIYLEKLKELRYSESTQRTYTNMFERFLSDHYNYRPDEVTNEVISKYLRHLVQEVGVSRSFQNQMINAIKFYYERVLGSPNYTYAIDRPRKEKLLPTVLTKQEIKTILQQIKNEKL